jgi:translocator protein
MKKWAGLAGWIAVSFVAAAVGSRFEPGAWYAALNKPPWTPPSWLFGPVWTVLYATMGVAAWLVWERAGFRGARVALALFGAQLVLNAAWSWLFFGLQRPGLAAAGILVLLAAIVATCVAFWRVRPAAGLLLLPYSGWVGFAAALNLAIWWLNR